MELELRRIARKGKYTIGRLYVNRVYFCDTLEDADLLYFGKSKIKGKTAIPTGRYEVLLNKYSPTFGKKDPYRELANGCVPLLKDVPGFSGVRIHIGNTVDDTDGCLLVGMNTIVGKLTKSKKTYVLLWNTYFAEAKKRGERVYINII
jgi:hypothetical protein